MPQSTLSIFNQATSVFQQMNEAYVAGDSLTVRTLSRWLTCLSATAAATSRLELEAAKLATEAYTDIWTCAEESNRTSDQSVKDCYERQNELTAQAAGVDGYAQQVARYAALGLAYVERL